MPTWSSWKATPTATRRQRARPRETIPGKGWFTILRLYGPLEPFFTKAWRPSEIEPVE